MTASKRQLDTAVCRLTLERSIRVSKSFKKIDRGTLLKGSGAAAFLAMLAMGEAASSTPPTPPPGKRCCDPGDYGFNSGNGKTAKGFVTIKGFRVIGATAGGPKPATPAGWTPKYFIPAANGFGQNGKHVLNDAKNVDIYVYTK